MAALSRRARWPVSAALLFVTALACDPGAVSSPSGTSRPSGASPTVAAATTTPKSDQDAGVILEEFPPGGPRNEVGLKNSDKMRFKARASIRLHRITTDEVKPVNVASAVGSCTDCQTIAVAFQVVFYKRGTSNIGPENVALAENIDCTRCVTVARAIQYVIPVDDPQSDVPPDVDRLVKAMDKELRFLSSVKTWDQITSDEAMARIQRVLGQYDELSAYLGDAMQTQRADNATPGPSAFPSSSGYPPASPDATTGPSPLPTSTP